MLILLHFQPAQLCPVDEKALRQKGSGVCVRLESISTPAVGDLQGGLSSMWERHQ